MAERTLIVRVIGDDRSLQAALARDEKAVKKFGTETELAGGRFAKFNQALRGGLSGFGGRSSLLFGSGAFLSTAAITAAAKTSIDAASDLNEQITKSQQVFGASSAAIEAWSKSTARSIGVSQEQALEAAGTFGNLFSSIHLGAQQSADVSRRLVQLAADLASFNNADPSDVLQALRSGLVGEAEPLRRFGVLLSEARVQQEALRETGKTNVKSLTDQEKALARINIIFQDTTKAQGDFGRTSDGLANTQRILSAETKDLEANLGKLLLPAVQKLTGDLADATGQAAELANGLQTLAATKVPAIHIPLIVDTGAGGGVSVGDVARKLADQALQGFEIAFPGLKAFEDARDVLAKAMQKQADANTPALASQFEQTLGGFFSQSLEQAGERLKTGGAKPIPNAPFKGAVGALLGSTIDQALSLAKGELGTAIKGEQAALDKAAADTARDKLSESFQKLVDGLQLDVDKAGLTKALGDDLDALLALKAGLERQVKAGVDVASAQSQLVQVVGQIADTRDEIRQKAADALQAHQFRALGLSATGDEIVPGVDNLAKRLNAVLAQVGSGDLNIGSKLANQLRAARKLINTEGDKLTRDTRAKINEFIKAVNGGDSSQKLQGPLTRNSAFNASKIIEGLGLTPELERTIRQRVASFNNADIKFPTPRTSSNVNAFGVPIIVENHNTITLDGDVVGRSVSRSQQKTARRNPVQKRGPNRNI